MSPVDKSMSIVKSLFIWIRVNHGKGTNFIFDKKKGTTNSRGTVQLIFIIKVLLIIFETSYIAANKYNCEWMC